MCRKRHQSINGKAASSLLLTAIFLLLGFCPLRNTLVTFGHSVKAVPKVPEYAKTMASDNCALAVVDKLIPASGKMLIPHLQVAWLHKSDSLIGSRFSVVTDRYQLPHLTASNSQIRIYLRNRSLLI